MFISRARKFSVIPNRKKIPMLKWQIRRGKMQMVRIREAALATETPVSVEVEGEENFGVTVGR